LKKIAYTPPYHLRSNGYLCNQIATYISPTSTVIGVGNLGQILHEVGCPGIDPSSVYWVDAGPPSTAVGVEAREEIKTFIYRRWHYLRIILIDKKDEIIQSYQTGASTNV